MLAALMPLPCPMCQCRQDPAKTGVTDVVTIEKTEETAMRLKLLSPGEMNADQKQTYDESIAGKRGKPPPPMMAWLNSPEMARHATRLGGFLRFDTIFGTKLSEIAILVTHARLRRPQGKGDLRCRQVAA
jgi:hypothetical protein